MIGLGIAALLISDPTCSAAVQGTVYPLLLPEKAALPTATFQVISDVPTYTLDGLTFAKARVQIDAWGLAYGDASNVAQVIRTVLERYAGTLPNGLLLSSSEIDDGPIDYYEPDSRLYRAQTDYVLYYSQPTQ